MDQARSILRNPFRGFDWSAEILKIHEKRAADRRSRNTSTFLNLKFVGAVASSRQPIDPETSDSLTNARDVKESKACRLLWSLSHFPEPRLYAEKGKERRIERTMAENVLEIKTNHADGFGKRKTSWRDEREADWAERYTGSYGVA